MRAGEMSVCSVPLLKSKRRFQMKSTSIPATGLLVLIFFVVGATSMGTAQANNAFGFNSPNIAGFPTGAAELTGGGAYNPATGFVHSGGDDRVRGRSSRQSRYERLDTRCRLRLRDRKFQHTGSVGAERNRALRFARFCSRLRRTAPWPAPAHG